MELTPQMGAVRVVCTGRGTHERKVVAVVFDEKVASMRISAAGQKNWSPPDGQHNVFRFRCPACGRAPELRAETWERLRAGVIEAGHTETDLSHWPF